MVNKHQPIAAITSPSGTHNFNEEEISGFGQPGSNVVLKKGTTTLPGSSFVRPDGTWSVHPTLDVNDFNFISGTDFNSTTAPGTTNTITVFQTATTTPDVVFDPDVTFSSGSVATLSGEAYGTSTVDLFSDNSFIGQANVDPTTHRWTQQYNAGPGFRDSQDIEAAPSFAGARVKSPYELITGIQGEPFRAEQILSSPDGTKENIAYSDKNGRLLYDSSVNLSTGEAVAFLTGAGSPVRYSVLGDKSDTITNFRLSGVNHDTLDLAGSGLHSRNQVFNRAFTSGGDTTIRFHGDSITLDGVTKAELRAHPQDLTF